MAEEKLIKSFTIGEDTCKVDYDALANKPFEADEVAKLKNIRPREIKFIDYIVDETKDPIGQPIASGAYDNGRIDSVQILRYACPERIDNDKSVDATGAFVDGYETHGDYVKDMVEILTRDGDFGFVEMNGSGQFNFRPVYGADYTDQYVLVPEVYLDAEKTIPAIAESRKKGGNYKAFKSPWLTGIKDVYRFTKVCDDLFISLKSVKESDLAAQAHTITYEVIAPEGFDVENLPTIRVFRCSDQAEKYFKYYLHKSEGAYKTLDDEMIAGTLLTLTEDTSYTGGIRYFATGISYIDDTGYPGGGEKDKVTILIDSSNVPEEYSVSAAKSGSCKNLNPGDFGPTKVLTGISGASTITVTIAAPVNVEYDDQGYTRTHQEDSKTKLDYGFEEESCPEVVASGSDFVFTVVHGHEYNNKDADGNVVKDDGSPFTVNDAASYIDSMTIGNEAVTSIADAITITPLSFTKKKVKITVKGSKVTGDIVIKLAPEQN